VAIRCAHSSVSQRWSIPEFGWILEVLETAKFLGSGTINPYEMD